jgi:hypothetical protein
MASRIKEERAKWLQERKRASAGPSRADAARPPKSGGMGIGAAAAAKARATELSVSAARGPPAVLSTTPSPRVGGAASSSSFAKTGPPSSSAPAAEKRAKPTAAGGGGAPKRPKHTPTPAAPPPARPPDVPDIAARDAASLRPAAAAEPTDAEVCRLLLSILNKASGPLAMSALALAAKGRLPTVPWNFAKWLQAVGRTASSRPALFSQHAGSMISLAAGAGEADDTRGGGHGGAAHTGGGASAAPVTGDGGESDTGGEGGEAAGGGGAEDDLFGDIDDL